MTSEGDLSNFMAVGQSVLLYETHMYSFANNDFREHFNSEGRPRCKVPLRVRF